MNEQEFLARLAEQYRREGYSVTTRPDKDLLPEGLGELDLLAQKGGESVAVRVKGRDQLYDLNDLQVLSERLKQQAGWRLEVIVFPPDGGAQVPPDGEEVGAAYISSLVQEARLVLAAGGMRSSFVVAWSAAEAAMREAARREGIAIERDAPRFVLKTLYANGVIAREDYDRGEQCFRLRNAVVHGFAPPKLEAEDIEFLLEFATRLLAQEPLQSGS